MNDACTGLYRKYCVYRTDGRDMEGGDREKARYFVLDYIHDPYARRALELYAQICEQEYPYLSQDLQKELKQTEQ